MSALPEVDLSKNPLIRIVSSKEQFDSEIAEHHDVLVFFSAKGCPPCQRVLPGFNSLSNQHEKIKFVKVDAEELEDVACMYEVNTLPTFILFHNGKPFDKCEGVPHKRPARRLFELLRDFSENTTLKNDNKTQQGGSSNKNAGKSVNKQDGPAEQINKKTNSANNEEEPVLMCSREHPELCM